MCLSRLCSKNRFSPWFHRSFINIRWSDTGITTTSYIKEHVVIPTKIQDHGAACINTIPSWWTLWSCGNRCESSFLACETCYFFFWWDLLNFTCWFLNHHFLDWADPAATCISHNSLHISVSLWKTYLLLLLFVPPWNMLSFKPIILD